ncbi:MAG: plasmid pRiA4b ORF-3 family protein [Chloroflexi bacterium]|nr:plasmid pRiA4b ORF-3 family protein [Chloroflexota bacterium]
MLLTSPIPFTPPTSLTSEESTPLQLYQVHVLLLEISPAIWRRLLVRSDSSIADLHYTLQITMGWEDVHLHRFVLHGKEYGLAQPGGMWFDDDPWGVRLSDLHLRLKERFLYQYDMGDYWQHQLRLERVLPFDPTQTYPLCIGGTRQAPPEDCGGPEAFMALRQQHTPWRIELRLMEMLEMLGVLKMLEVEEPCGQSSDQVGGYGNYGHGGCDNGDYCDGCDGCDDRNSEDYRSDLRYNLRLELRQLDYWLNVEKFDRRAANRRLRQYAQGDDRWRLPQVIGIV